MSQILYFNKHEIDFVAYVVSSKTIIRFVDDKRLMIYSYTRPFNTSSLQLKYYSHYAFSSDGFSNSLSNDLPNSLSDGLSHVISFWISVCKIFVSRIDASKSCLDAHCWCQISSLCIDFHSTHSP